MQQGIGEESPELVTVVCMECEDIVTRDKLKDVLLVTSCQPQVQKHTCLRQTIRVVHAVTMCTQVVLLGWKTQPLNDSYDNVTRLMIS